MAAKYPAASGRDFKFNKDADLESCTGKNSQSGNSQPGNSQPVTHVVALIKGQERYIFIFDDAGRAKTLRTLGRFATNPDLSFSWFDAANLSQRIREGVKHG